MSWTNLHTHCNFCDGHGSPATLVKRAQETGLDGLGFSSHAPLPFPTRWAMKAHRLGEYLREIQRLKSKYSGTFPVYLGLEADYVPHFSRPSDFSARYNLDYIIGSVHFAGYSKSLDHWSVDCPPERFEAGIQDIFGGDTEALFTEYYRRIAYMAEHSPPDIIGHLDLIKKNNRDNRFFSEESPAYRSAVERTLQVISKTRCIVEVNTGGISRGYTDSVYPSPWILRRCRALDIPVTLSADVHSPDFLTAGLDDAAAVLRDVGYREIRVLTVQGWEDVPLCTAN